MAAEYFCASCRTPFLNDSPLDDNGNCRLCRGGMRGFDAAYCFGSYEGTLRELIHLFKYRRIKPLSVTLSRFMASALPLDQRFDAVIPVPLHWRRKWDRGFNQSELLARAMARRCGIGVSRAVKRRRSTSTQAGLTNAERRTNVAGAFRMRRGVNLTGQRILLIDDVMTTGATASACASVLKRAGAKSVTLLTLARVDRRLADTATAKFPGVS